MEQQFYKCRKCGQIVAMVKKTGSPLVCCGEEMVLMKANTTDGAKEKHVPVYKVDGNMVRVVIGETAHPMQENHYIEWISLQTSLGNQRKVLKPGDAPEAAFVMMEGEEIQAVYAYCNLHGLWKA